MLQKLPTTSTNVHYKSLIDKYIKRHATLHFIYLVEFIAKYDTKSCKKIVIKKSFIGFRLIYIIIIIIIIKNCYYCLNLLI
jgi:hypothetical protein